jgi:replicative DNA helicase
MPKVWEARTLADAFVADQEERHKNPDAYRGYRFPMDWWMDKTGGMQKGWLTYVFGKAGIGKSSVLTTSAVQNGQDGVPFVYFSLEESVWVTAQRVFANLSHIDRIRFRDVKLEATDFHNLKIACGEFGLFDAYFVDDAWDDEEITNTLEWIDSERTKNNLPPLEVVYLDYHQLMSIKGATTQTEHASKGSKFLVRIAKGKVTPGVKAVMAACQLNDAGEPLWSRDPSRDGDLIVEISGIDDGFKSILPDRRKLRITKFRHGDIASTDCQFIGARSKIGQAQDPIAVGKMKPPSI